MCGPTRRQVLLAGAALPLLPHLSRSAPTVALGGVDVQPRSAWGGDLKPTGPLSEEAPGDVRFLLVHHTASPNGYKRADVPGLLRGFYSFHTTDRKWPDLAYGFMVDRFGQVWEGRTGSLNGPVKADATGGSQGFALLACFIGDHTREPPSAEALDAMGKLLGALATRHSIDVRPGSTATFVSRGSNLHPPGKQVTTPTIAGHRDMSKTSCPGDACYQLLPTRLVPAAVAAAAVPAVVTPPAPAVTTDPAAAIPAPPAPAETLPPANAGGGTLDTTPQPSLGPPPTTFLGAGGRRREEVDPPRGVVAAAAAGAAVVAGGLVALVLRRRASARESGHWTRARDLEEPAAASDAAPGSPAVEARPRPADDGATRP